MAWTHKVVKNLQRDGFGHTTTIAAELKRVEHGSSRWEHRTVLVVDEAAMLSTRDLGALVGKAREAGAKLILAGDDRQLTEHRARRDVRRIAARAWRSRAAPGRRVSDAAQRRALNLMHEGDFRSALEVFAARGDIHWRGTRDDARDALVRAVARTAART